MNVLIPHCVGLLHASSALNLLLRRITSCKHLLSPLWLRMRPQSRADMPTHCTQTCSLSFSQSPFLHHCPSSMTPSSSQQRPNFFSILHGEEFQVALDRSACRQFFKNGLCTGPSHRSRISQDRRGRNNMLSENRGDQVFIIIAGTRGLQNNWGFHLNSKNILTLFWPAVHVC